MKKYKGFTLIELLVVISIIALLMSMLMPALSRVREQAKTVSCMSRLKQWGVVYEMFTQDNNGYFNDFICIEDDVYFEYYQDYEMKICPQATKLYEEGGRDPFATHIELCDETPASYGTNAWQANVAGSNRADDYLWKTPNVKQADLVPVYGDIQRFSNTTPFAFDNPPSYSSEPHTPGNIDEIKNACIIRHRNIVQWLFADWSVRKVGLKELWDLRWHRHWVEEKEEAG
jgi:prepilin-type N-terminal cleavage/methylation domain-containing protein